MKTFIAVMQILMATVLLALAAAVAAQQAYPSKPIRFVVPFPPGGGADPVARIVGQKLTEKWGQHVVVDNRPGGNTIIGNNAVAKAAPDGYTMLLATTGFVTGPSLLRLPYDTIKDFDAVATLTRSRYVLVLHPSVAANTLQEFIALAKARQGEITYASAGVGGTTHLSGELFNMMVGARMQHIPYKGSAPLITDLIGGRVHLSFNNAIATMAPHIKTGRLKAIAITGETRLAALSQVPTFAEAGLPEYDLSGWFAIVVPAGTPKTIIDKMSREVAVLLSLPDIQESFARQGIESFITTSPDKVTAFIRAEIARYGKIIKAANIKLESGS